jgi:hypothetical protein
MQSILRIIKDWHRYERRGEWGAVPRWSRGVYVLYNRRAPTEYEVVYIGVAGIGPNGGGGMLGRLRSHDRTKGGWSHFSTFEVHDNVHREDVLELEALLLGIFQHDGRIQIKNKQNGSRKLEELRRKTLIRRGPTPNSAVHRTGDRVAHPGR